MNQYRQTEFSFNSFKPNARLLVLLGDQLIRDPGIAVFELVKNAYDADSPFARVTLSNVSSPLLGKIIVEDAGIGMDLITINEIWLVLGTNNRIRQKVSGRRTSKFNRIPMGEMGVGRFAVHKLGNSIKVTTRAFDNPEIVINIDWEDFSPEKSLSDIPVKIESREPQIFKGNKTGTRIEITDLRNAWDPRMVRELYRSVNSICSPFESRGDFQAELIITSPQEKDWIKGLLRVENVLEYAIFHASGEIIGKKLTYDYLFKPLPGMDRVEGRHVDRKDSNALSLPVTEEQDEILKSIIGPISFDFYIYDRDPKILSLGVTDKKGLKEFLDQNGGIRVYRDGIRVYDYGEPGNDWLKLGGRRVNIPTQRISNNIIVGAVSIQQVEGENLKSRKLSGLIEKTNREGFVDNEAFQAFSNAVIFTLTQVESERNYDKRRIRNAYASGKVKEPVLDVLTDLREIVDKKKMTAELGPYLNRIETDFLAIRDRLLTSATAGLSLSVVIHEVEKGIAELVKAVENEQSSPRVIQLVKHIADLTEGYGALIRQSGLSQEKGTTMIKQALFNTEYRLDAHHIEPKTDFSRGDFSVKCSRRLVISTIMNLIDNSIYWLEVKYGKSRSKKKIYFGLFKSYRNGPAIIVADNGPGFIDPPEYLTEPFVSRKPEGMGLGLHLASEVMKAQGGTIDFPHPDEIDIPKEFTGAIIALIFKE